MDTNLENTVETIAESQEKTKEQLAANEAAREEEAAGVIEQEGLRGTPTDVYHYGLGRYLTSSDSQNDIEATREANKVGDAIWQLHQAYPNFSDAQLEAQMSKGGLGAWRRTYGGYKSVFSPSSMSNREAAEKYISSRQAYEEKKAAEATDKARAAYEAQYKVRLGDNDIAITKDFSDNIKAIGEAWTRVKEDDEKIFGPYRTKLAYYEQDVNAGAKGLKEPTPPQDVNVDKRREIVGSLREELNAAGFNLGPAPESGEFDNVEDLIKSAPDWKTESAIRDALDMAENRKEYNPETDKIPFAERLRQRQEAQLAIDRDVEARRIEKARLGRSFAGLARTLGDMIRASEGAPVTPWDWQNIYDNLTAQEKANINNYQIRMQQLNNERRQERAQAAKDNLAMQLLLQKQGWQSQENAKKRSFTGDENEKNRNLKWIMRKVDEDLKRYYIHLRWGQGGADDPSKTHTLILLGDNAMMIPKGQTFLNAVNSINRILASGNSYYGGVPTGNVSLLQDIPEAETDAQQFFNRTTQILLSGSWNDLTPQARDSIITKLRAMKGQWVDKPADTTSGPSELEDWF